jgi:hypothetical protein
VLNTGSSRDPFNGDQISFATSLQQARQDNASANQPYGLGAGSRRPPPAKSPFDIWAEGSFARFEDGNEASQREGHWGVLFVGADYRVSPNLLIGALASFDDAQQDLTGLSSKARSTGWMVGPYATMRLTDNLFSRRGRRGESRRMSWAWKDLPRTVLTRIAGWYAAH